MCASAGERSGLVANERVVKDRVSSVRVFVIGDSLLYGAGAGQWVFA
jgi:hypothetical protein